MTEEQIKQKFEETYPDFMRGDEPLSPYFDIWEYGIELATKELQDENRNLKNLISSLVYEINQIWDINEMNDDLRRCAEKIEREVTLSKIADDNRIVLNALEFALVPPKPKADVKEI